MQNVTRDTTASRGRIARSTAVRDWWIWLALAVAVFSVYLQTRNFEFLGYDDPEFVVNNVDRKSVV